jgi:hypothetical protein
MKPAFDPGLEFNILRICIDIGQKGQYVAAGTRKEISVEYIYFEQGNKIGLKKNGYSDPLA